MSARHKEINDTLVNAKMLCTCVDEILSRIQLDRDHDIPYLAGYSVDRKKIYIDRHLEKCFTDHRGHQHDVDKFLILHEATEKAMIDSWGLHYQHAHQIALRARRRRCGQRESNGATTTGSCSSGSRPPIRPN